MEYKTKRPLFREAFLYTENHPLGGWFQRAYGFTPLWKAEIL